MGFRLYNRLAYLLCHNMPKYTGFQRKLCICQTNRLSKIMETKEIKKKIFLARHNAVRFYFIFLPDVESCCDSKLFDKRRLC